MTERTWTPTPQLATAVSLALLSFARHWPRAMALALDPSEAGRAYVADYARALLGCDLEAIPEAAQRWLSDNQKPPRPNEFAVLARAVARELRPVQYANVVNGGTDSSQSLPVAYEQTQRIEQRSRRIKQSMASWREVSEVWALLYASAPDDTARHAVRVGDVPLDVIDDAVAAHKRGVRSIPGPLAAAAVL